MKALIRMELRKALYNKWFTISLLIGCSLAIISAVLILVPYYNGLRSPMPGSMYTYPNIRSSFCFWMNVELQTPTSPLFYRLAPLLAIIPYTWSLLSEMQSGYINQIYVRVPRMHYVAAKSIAVFVAGGCIGSIPQVLNFLIHTVFVPSRMPSILDSFYTGMGTENLWSWFFFNTPLLFVLFYSLLGFLLCGLWALLCLNLSFFVKNRVVLITTPYLMLMIIQFINERIFVSMFGGVRGVQLSLFENLHAMSQPYFSNGWVILCEAIVLLAASLIISWIGLKKDPI